MITIVVKKEKNQIKQILFEGHAEFANPGKDIVCAGVSSILTTTVNAILRFDGDAVTYTDKNDFVLTIQKWDKNTRILIENMLDLLKELEKDYPKNIKIRED